MMNVILVASSKKPHAASLIDSIQKFLIEQNIQIAGAYLLDDIDKEQQAAIASQFSKKSIDLVVSIGGDGSLLKLAHTLGLPLPRFVGINLGSLGFLAEISVKNMTAGLYEIIQGRYQATDRLLIEGIIRSHPPRSILHHSFAINECTLHRGSYPNLIDIAIHVDGIYLNTFSCDGVIISTPSGSTAYSLAAGGPIMTPELQAIVITPICPHTISNKPIVLLPKKMLSIECVRGGAEFDVSFDGQHNFRASHDDVVEITISQHRFETLAPITGSDYFHTIRTKLGWTGSLRQ